MLLNLEWPIVLSLWGWYFFHVDPGYWVPACVGISDSIVGTFTDPESHAHDAFGDPLTDTVYLTHTQQILFASISMNHVDDSINGLWSWALCTVEGEIPPAAATMATIDTKNTIEIDSQRGIGRLLVEKAFLWKLITKQAQRWRLCQLVTQLFRMIYSTPTKFSQWDSTSAKTFLHSPYLPVQLLAKLSFRKCWNPYLYQASIPSIIQVLVNTLSPVSLQ